MQIKQIIAKNYLEENCYVLEKGEASIVIDPGCTYEELIPFLNDHVEAILITHHHFDHVVCLEELKRRTNAPVYDASCFQERVNTKSFSFSMIKTKGHSKDSVTYYFEEEKVLFTGDFLFQGSIGRCDLEGGSMEEMMKSLQKIEKYPSDLIVYPGHGEKTTLGNEKKTNPYLAILRNE